MTKRSEELRTNSAECGDPLLDNRTQPRVGSEEIEEALETGWEEGQPPSTDEIRLQAYYRYLEREGGDDDEIADWLTAESELRQRGDAGRAAEQTDERP
jgi:Protein of unknown function (DUF2934)